MVKWASDTLPESEVDAFNSTMQTQNPAMIQLAVQGLFSRYSAEAEPNLVRADGNVTSGGNKFNSTAEMTAAMRDPRYANDPHYRSQVSDKLARSSIF